MKKVLKWVGLGIAGIVLALIIFVQVTWDKTYDSPYPNITVSSDSAALARGKYLIYGPAHCATCHVPTDKMPDIDKGIEVPLIGGWELSIPLGTFRAPNLTPDKETGIGNMTDGQLARAIRHQVAADGSIVAPFMEYQQMSDEDLGAMISYLRSTEPIRHEVAPSEYVFMGKALQAFGMLAPKDPHKTPPRSVAKAVTVEYGEYMANDVAVCKTCHTPKDMAGKPIGPAYSGGQPFEPHEIFDGYGFVSPNITTDPESGFLANWTEEMFIARFRAGRIHQNSPMAWGSYSRMDETDLKAIYAYLQAVEPAYNVVEKTVYSPGEEFPQ